MTRTMRRLFVSLNLYIAGTYNNSTEAYKPSTENKNGGGEMKELG
jgi:hypothetical protein